LAPQKFKDALLKFLACGKFLNDLEFIHHLFVTNGQIPNFKDLYHFVNLILIEYNHQPHLPTGALAHLLHLPPAHLTFPPPKFLPQF
jgi:hypothetical protein